MLNSKPDSIGLSAIIPITKMAGRTQYIQKIIEHAVEQKVKLIIVHDIQDNETGVELESLTLGKSKFGIELVHGYFGDPGQARNFGLNLCKTEWVTFWDSDDEVRVDQFVDMLKQAKVTDSEVGIGLIGVSKLNTHNVSDALTNELNLYLQIANFPGFTRMIFKRNRLPKNPFPPLRFGEDLVFLANAKIFSSRIFLFNVEIYTYNVGTSFQATYKKPSSSQISSLLEELLEAFTRAEKAGQDFILSIVIKIVLSRIASNSILKDLLKYPSLFIRIALYAVSRYKFTFKTLAYFLRNRPGVVRVIHD